MHQVFAIAAAIIASPAIPAEEPKKSPVEIVQVQTDERSGPEEIAALRKAYEAGEYQSFLSNTISTESLAEFIQLRAAAPVLETPTSDWETHLQALIDERNHELSDACKNQGDALVCKRVASLTAPLPAEQKKALAALSQFRFKTPDQAKNDDERALILLDLAAEYKMMHLEPNDDLTNQHIVIKMDLLKQMVEASRSFTNIELKQTVEQAAVGFDLSQARQWDYRLLSQQKPSSELEKNIASILSLYKMKREDLYQKEVLAKS